MNIEAVGPSGLLVYSVLKELTTEHGSNVVISQAAISGMTGLSLRTVKRTTQRLAALKLIEPHFVIGVGTAYTVHPLSLPAVDWKPAKSVPDEHELKSRAAKREKHEKKAAFKSWMDSVTYDALKHLTATYGPVTSPKDISAATGYSTEVIYNSLKRLIRTGKVERRHSRYLGTCYRIVDEAATVTTVTTQKTS